MTLVALVCMVATVSAQTVYISTGDGAVAYHKSKSCSYLTNSKDVKSVSTSEAKKLGRHECSRCYGTAASAASKKEVKKATTQARDEKGRFVKKTTTEKKAVEKKAKKTTTQARDEKGRFVKKTETIAKKTAEKKTTTEKKAVEKKITDTKKKATTPARDEKGRFIKKTDEKKAKKAA